MDVVCERCKTEYELDETRISEAGLTVKCTQCGSIFKVRKPFVTTPGLEVPPPKEWRVRRQDGQQLALRNLTELQRWIVERRVGPNDEVSLSGETWRRLGTLPELGVFFEVVQGTDKAQAFGAPPAVSNEVAMGATIVGMHPNKDTIVSPRALAAAGGCGRCDYASASSEGASSSSKLGLGATALAAFAWLIRRRNERASRPS